MAKSVQYLLVGVSYSHQKTVVFVW